ncbi:CPBP family intramembrane metalloprotease domain-containing protein [Cyanobium sp. FGCU-6]|nr:CPBP family intramembrane metalloprotease domain-containing protein [Cyanobium sp. FGCU6]
MLAVAGAAHLLAASTAPSPVAGSAASEDRPSSYALAQRMPFNRPGFFPLDRRPDPALYRPRAAWQGRLILPTAAEARQHGGDWVWIELELAPPAQGELVGRRLRLTWQERPELQRLVALVTTDIRLTPAARRAIAAGNVLPERLDGRRAVGPLQSLAGARPHDDVIVRLEGTVEVRGGGETMTELWVDHPPIQTTGRYEGLVRVLGPDPAAGADRFRVRHWNRSSGRFDGPLASVRIPRQPRDADGRHISTPDGLAASPAGAEGWYLQGAPDAQDVFTVQSLEPRALMRPQADRVLQADQGRHWIRHGNWGDTERQKGRMSTVAVAPRPWRIGDRALLLHAFGGIGGERAEPTPGFTVTGHFAFGEARVVADPFSGEPRFELRFHQIYAHNPNAIVAGSQDWSAYAGDLQRGWLASRPLSEVLVQLPALEGPPGTDGNLSLPEALALQAEVLMARYRSGDGTGLASVTPATSCVQDSSQALFLAIQQLRHRLAADPATAERAAPLAAVGRSLDALLTPFGLVRPDWRANAALLNAAERGSSPPQPFQAGQSLGDVLLSWRSMLPRRAHDDVAAVLLRHGAGLWFLRTNQIPGGDPEIEPLAPTVLLGQLGPVASVLQAVTDALVPPLPWRGRGR